MQAKLNQDLIDRLVVKFSVIKENVGNVKEAIGSGTLADSIREAKQLAYSANSLVKFLEELEATTVIVSSEQQKAAPTMSEALALTI